MLFEIRHQTVVFISVDVLTRFHWSIMALFLLSTPDFKKKKKWKKNIEYDWNEDRWTSIYIHSRKNRKRPICIHYNHIFHSLCIFFSTPDFSNRQCSINSSCSYQKRSPKKWLFNLIEWNDDFGMESTKNYHALI